jgi:hypothetical protein
MLKMFLNLLLSLILGSLKELLLKHIDNVNAENFTNKEKRDVVFNAFKADVKDSGKNLKDSMLNLAIEAGVTLVKQRLGV